MGAAVVVSPVVCRSPHDSLAAAIECAARDDAPLLTFHGGKDGEVRLPAREAFARARRWAALFRRHGVRRGDRVVLLLPTGEAFATALCGAGLCGAAPVPLATPMTFGSTEPFLRNLSAIVENARPSLVLTVPRVITALKAASITLGVPVLTPQDRDDLSELDVASAHATNVSVGGTDTALIQYTSGTTGKPKGVVIPHRALVANAYAIANGLSLGASDVGVSWLPLFHDMGLVGVLLTGVCHPYPIHVAAPEYFAMGAQRWMALAARVGATITAAPNFAYEMAASRASRLEDEDLGALRFALNGAEPVQPSTVRRFESAYARNRLSPGVVLPVYGMAECTLAVAFPTRETAAKVARVDRRALEQGEVRLEPGAETAQELACVGRPVAGTSIVITDERGRQLGERELGGIRVRGESVMTGYFDNDEASAAALGSDGWLDTGDLGFVHEGQLYVTGRAKDVIIQAGRNVYPYDLERVAVEAARLRPGAVVALGRRNEEKGTEEIVLVAETALRDEEERAATARLLKGEILAVLGVRVEEIHLWPLGAVPKTTSGKARRRECATILAAGGPA
jgi:acyl-CoA synthetase (AMP-forming)/AMP-acid ligase II